MINSEIMAKPPEHDKEHEQENIQRKKDMRHERQVYYNISRDLMQPKQYGKRSYGSFFPKVTLL